MESLPPGDWNLTCPNITQWYEDLRQAMPTVGTNRARDYIHELAGRIDCVTRLPVYEEESSIEEPVEVTADPPLEEEPGDKLEDILNDPPVSI